MEEFSKARNVAAADAFIDGLGGAKQRLTEPQSIFDAVDHLRAHGYCTEEIHHCLVRYFYVDLDLLNAALSLH